MPIIEHGLSYKKRWSLLTCTVSGRAIVMVAMMALLGVDLLELVDI